MAELQPIAEYVFECSWEICNKVGGIYTVVKTKAASMQSYYSNYILVGPYFKKKAEIEFEYLEPPKSFAKAFDVLAQEGIICHYGKWNIKSEPVTILIEFLAASDHINDIKKELWDRYQVDSIRAGWEFEEPVLWSWYVARMIEEVSKNLGSNNVVSHWHEWLAGAGLLYLRSKDSSVKTVFTTHATMLGRTLSGSGRHLYEELSNINPDEEARRYGIEAKYTLEKAAAHQSHVFTTVSEITGMEAEKILGRKPEVLVLNGLDIKKFPTMEENTIKHVTSRERIREFFTYHFFPHYTFEMEHTLLFFIVGRYEYKNKGIDVFVDALAKLNDKLQKEKNKHTVCALFWIPQPNNGLEIPLLENKNFYQHIKNVVESNSKELLQTIISDFVSGRDPGTSSIFTKEFLSDMKKDILHFRRTGNPFISTHKLRDPDHNDILQNLVRTGLDNKENDKVKVIYNPVYLDGNDQLLNLPYYDAMAGCHLGVFPSYYEPWGYTPLESMALGVPAVTSDFAGFGRFIEKEVKDTRGGITVLKRMGKSYEEVVEQLFKAMYDFCNLNHAERVQRKMQAKNLSNLADWKHFVKNYIQAHNLALSK